MDKLQVGICKNGLKRFTMPILELLILGSNIKFHMASGSYASNVTCLKLEILMRVASLHVEGVGQLNFLQRRKFTPSTAAGNMWQ